MDDQVGVNKNKPCFSCVTAVAFVPQVEIADRKGTQCTRGPQTRRGKQFREAEYSVAGFLFSTHWLEHYSVSHRHDQSPSHSSTLY